MNIVSLFSPPEYLFIVPQTTLKLIRSNMKNMEQSLYRSDEVC